MLREEVRSRLFALKDDEYKKFHTKLVPNLDEDFIIGIRVPVIRKFAKELYAKGVAEEYLSLLPHKYYEEKILHGFLIEQIKDYDTVIAYVEEYLPYIDNWATCDSFSPKIFKKNIEDVRQRCFKWIESDMEYTVRYGVVTLMQYFLDEHFTDEVLEKVISIKRDEYYINMAIAWFMSYAIVKQYDKAIAVIESDVLDKFIHNKSIQKSIESRRVSDEKKDYLRTLRKQT